VHACIYELFRLDDVFQRPIITYVQRFIISYTYHVGLSAMTTEPTSTVAYACVNCWWFNA